MRIGISLLPELDWAQDRPRWQRAEAYGFDHAWMFDHLAWRSLADGPWYATIPTLTAAVLATSTLRVGTWVTTPNFRHPVPLAKDLMTIDRLSGGRLNIGVGAGASGLDAGVLGGVPLTPAQAMARYEEFVTVLDLCLRQQRTSWQGTWFTAAEARTIPGPVQQPRPPLIVAANGRKGTRLAARQGDGWATAGSAPREADERQWWQGVAESVAHFEQALAEAGRSALPRYLNLERIPQLMCSLERIRDAVGRAADLGFTDVVVPWPRAEGVFAANESIFDDLAADRTAGSTEVN
jgi:alkanesulfonate monooxygenase SsuD/methylene tetrahydromethanopterin reductase-like flavin-dependent oxidoreductase (luciferase family)